MRQFLVVIVLLVTPLAAHAQTSAESFSSVARKLKPGQRAIVWRDAGDAVSGRIIRANDQSLTLAWAGQELEIPLASVQRVERPKDRVWDGALVGFGIGFAFGAISMATCEGEILCSHKAGPVLGLGAFTGAIGFAAGALVDALIRHKRVIFERATPAGQVQIAPMWSSHAGGIGVQMRF